MPKMTAVEAAVRVLEKEDVSVAFGVPPGALLAERPAAPRPASGCHGAATQTRGGKRRTVRDV